MLLGLASAPVHARENLGLFEDWAGFRDTRPARCYAIAEPIRPAKNARWRPFASIASFPGQARNQVQVRLRQPRAPGTQVQLRIGGKRFTLLAGGADAWAATPTMDAAIVAAMRGADRMQVGGDIYRLGGAASAIDAALIGCLKR